MTTTFISPKGDLILCGQEGCHRRFYTRAGHTLCFLHAECMSNDDDDDTSLTYHPWNCTHCSDVYKILSDPNIRTGKWEIAQPIISWVRQAELFYVKKVKIAFFMDLDDKDLLFLHDYQSVDERILTACTPVSQRKMARLEARLAHNTPRATKLPSPHALPYPLEPVVVVREGDKGATPSHPLTRDGDMNVLPPPSLARDGDIVLNPSTPTNQLLSEVVSRDSLGSSRSSGGITPGQQTREMRRASPLARGPVPKVKHTMDIKPLPSLLTNLASYGIITSSPSAALDETTENEDDLEFINQLCTEGKSFALPKSDSIPVRSREDIEYADINVLSKELSIQVTTREYGVAPTQWDTSLMPPPRATPLKAINPPRGSEGALLPPPGFAPLPQKIVTPHREAIIQKQATPQKIVTPQGVTTLEKQATPRRANVPTPKSNRTPVPPRDKTPTPQGRGILVPLQKTPVGQKSPLR